MIAFRCPRCQCQLTRADNEAGWKTSCPSCGQRLQIPQVSKSKDQTLLGELQGPGETKTMVGELSVQPAQPGHPAAGPLPVAALAEPDWSLGEPDLAVRRKYRQQPQQSWLGFVAVVFAVLCLLGCIGFGMASSNYEKRSKHFRTLKLAPGEDRVLLQDLKDIDDLRGYLAIGGGLFGFLAVVLASAVFMQVNKSKALPFVAYALSIVGLLIVVIWR